MCPHKTRKRERVAHISNQATSGTQEAGKPSANGGGQNGGPGGEAPWQGVRVMCPHKKRGWAKFRDCSFPTLMI